MVDFCAQEVQAAFDIFDNPKEITNTCLPPDDKDVEEDRDGKVEGITEQCLAILGKTGMPDNVKVCWLKTVVAEQIKMQEGRPQPHHPLCDKLRLALLVEPPDLVSVKGLLESRPHSSRLDTEKAVASSIFLDSIGEKGDKVVAGSNSAEAVSHVAGTCIRWKNDGSRFAAQPGKYFLFVCVCVCACVCVCVFD